MWSLFRYFYRHHVVILFIVLEVIAFVFIFTRNNFQRAAFMNSSNHVSGIIYTRYNAIVSYFRLSSVNNELAEENARLRQLIFDHPADSIRQDSTLFLHSLPEHSFSFIPARVINNSVHRQHNYLTLNKGSKDGVRPDMGVATADGVVGVVFNVSNSFSTVISLLNLRWNVSAKLKRNNYFGSLSWDGKDYKYALLNEIPFHVEIKAGDTIVTSGFSSIFPEGMMLGIVETFNKEGGDNFYNIRVRLSVDFKSLAFVEVIDYKQRNELDALEKMGTDDSNLD